MRILLVTQTENLLKNLDALNPELEYCGIVVDDVEPAKEILKNRGLSQVPLYPYSYNTLEQVIKTVDYDYFVGLAKEYKLVRFQGDVARCSFSGLQNKIVYLPDLSEQIDFLLERSIRYFREHATEFETFATGISTVEKGVAPAQFKRKLFNFGRGSQDLYYNLHVAKSAILCGGGHSKLRYALIGLTPYIFHYDLSKAVTLQQRILQYFIAFKDLNHFYIPVDTYEKLFSEEYLSRQLPLESFDVNVPYGADTKIDRVTPNLSNLNLGIVIRRRFFQKTRDENIKILDDYLTLCETNNIRPIMFTVTVTEKYIATFNPQLLEEFYVLVEQACQKHPSAVFFDGWKLKDFTYADFYDHEHLNVHGAAKFSAYLNDFIEELEFNYYRDVNNFYNHLNDSVEELDFRNHFEA